MPKGRGEHVWQVRVNLSLTLHHKVAMLAQEQHVQIGTIVRAIVEQYFVTHEQEGEAQLQQDGMVAALETIERRLQQTVVALSGRVETVAALVQQGNVSVDELAYSYFLHTPEVETGPQQNAAIKSGQRRRDEYRKRVEKRTVAVRGET